MNKRILYLSFALLLLPFLAQSQLAGTYTIGGTSPDYATITDATTDLNLNGISAAVTFDLRAGTYTEVLVLEEVIGASETNTITFKSETGSAADVIIQYDSPYNSNDYYVAKLDGTDHISFQNLTFEPLGTNYNIIFRLANGINNVEISNCIFNGNNANAIYNSYGGSSGNLRFTDNEFNNCREAISISNSSMSDLIISDNNFNSIHVNNIYDIYCYDIDSLIVHNNTLINPNGSAGIYGRFVDNTFEIVGNTVDVKFVGIDARNSTHVQVENNQVYNNNANTGLYIRDNGNAARRSSIINNVVSSKGDGFYLYGMDYADVYFNSILATGASSYEAFYQRSSDYTDIRNNIFSNEGGGLAVQAYSTTSSTQDYNAYYTTGSNLGSWQDVSYTDLADWQTVSALDANSVAANPVYTSNTDLRPNQALIDDAGTEITTYSIDIEGTTRSTPPDMGAYEFTAMGDNADIVFATPQVPFDPGTQAVTVNLMNSGPSILTSDSLYWTVNDVAQTPILWAGNLAVGDSENVTLGNYQFDEITEYEINIWSSRPNGAADIDPSGDTLLIDNFYTTLAGDFTVGGTSPDFADLTAARDALTYGGVRDSVRMLMRSGTYVERLSLEEFPGSSDVNVATFSAESGNAADVIIQFDSGYNSNDYYVAKLNGTDNIRFQNLTFEPLGSSHNIIIRLVGQINNVTFSNCIFNGNNAQAIYKYYNNGGGTNWRISNNEFNNCSDAIYLYDNGLDGIIISENTVNGTHTGSGYDIYSFGCDSLIVHDNVLTNPNGSSGIHIHYDGNYTEVKGNTLNIKHTGIYLRHNEQFKIENNQIYNNNNNSGIYVRDIGTSTARSSIVNNIISSKGDGLFLYDTDYTDVYFNSVLTTSTATDRRALYQRYSEHTDIRNNIFSNQGGAYAALVYSATNFTQDFNAYYTSGVNLMAREDNVVATLADWQSVSTLDSNSVAANPVYASTVDLTPNQALIDNAGQAIATYPLDIDGITRGTLPDMGAYEFTATGDNAGITFAAPQAPLDPASVPVTVDLMNSGPSILTSDSLYWTVNDVAQTPVLWTGNLAVGDSENVTLGNYQFDEITEYEINIWSSRPNGAADIDPSGDTLLIDNFYTTLAGDFTVGGTSPDFADLTAARDALTYGGVRDSVRMLMRSGTYVERLSLEEFPGSSDVNVATFSAESGNAADVIIQFDSGYNSNDYYVAKLNGTDNIRFQNLTFEPLGSSHNIIIRLVGQINNVTFSNCIFNGNNAQAIYKYYNNGGGTNWRISNNEFNNCSDAIYLYDNGLDGIIISENTVNGTHTGSGYDIYSFGCDSLIVHDNVLTNPNGSSGIHIHYDGNYTEVKGNTLNIKHTGIYLRHNEQFKIENNQIYNNNNNSGIYVRDIGTSTARSSIVNNIISSKGDGLFLYDTDYTDVYFNSVLTTSTASDKKALYQRYSDYTNIRNNIFSHQGGGLAIQSYPTTDLVQDYNDHHTTGATLGNWNGTEISDLTNWEFTTQQDANSISVDPLFQAIDDLHTNNILLAVGIPITSVTTDIDGDDRNPLSPYMGADESPGGFDDIGIVNLISPIAPFPQGTNDLIINVVNNFTEPLTSATISWSMNADTIREVSWTGNILSGTSANVTVASYQFDVAQPYDLKMWVGNPNGQADTYATNDTLEVEDMYAALIGTYTIGANNADFQTITQAVEALERGGVVGDVTFNIQDGTYSENIEINEILGASANDRIIFQSENQDSTSVTISNAANTGNTIFHLDSTDHIELRYLTFEQNYSNSDCITLSGTNENISINNCHFLATNVAIRVNNFVDNLQVTENIFDGSSYGFYDNSYNNSTNVLIENNLFSEQSTDAIRIRYYVSPIIRSNDIINTGSTSRGIHLISTREAFQIVGNTLTLNDATYGIDISTSSTSQSVHGIIGNNFISIGGISTTYGLNISGNYADIFHNNIHVTSTETTAGRAVNLSGSYYDLKNNIFANTGGGYAIYAANTNTITESDYNDFYAPGGRVGYWNGNRTALANWQSGSGFDANSFDFDPEFNSATDLHINQQFLSEQGTPVDGLPEDIDGDFRNPLTPDVGADEFTSLENNLGVIEILSPTTDCDILANSDVTIVIKNPGSLTQSTFDVAYQLGDDTPVVETINQTIAPGFTLEHTFATPVTLIPDSTYALAAYTLLGTDELTFNDTTSIEVISYPAVNLVVSPNATIDYGDTLTLTASGSATDYEWSGELEGENPFSPTLTVAPFETQIYQMTATDDNGCKATATVTITVNPLPQLPDLQVSNVLSGLTTVQPGDSATLTWVIGNIGDGAALVDWTEKVYIQAPDGSNRTLVGQFNYDETDSLYVGGFFNRTYDLKMPNALIIDEGVFVVEILPNVLEIPLATINNISIENQIWTVERILYLSLANDEINEGSGSVYCTVSRSGSTASSLTVNITPSDPARLNYASQVTIYAGQSGRTFYISAPNNSDLEGDMNINITASAASFTSDTESLLLIDDEIPALSITSLPTVIAEGDVLNFNISTNFPPTDSLFVNIIASEVEDVPLPTPVAIAPGTTTVNVQVTLPDDDFAEPDETVTITAGSAGLTPASGTFTLTNDEDIPPISFGLTIDTISESAGLYATQGVITRLGNTDAVLQVDISSDNPEALYMPSTVPLGPGEMEKTFYIGIFDNQQNEGFRDIEITASVLISACNCTASAASAGVYSDILTVADNDGASLSLSVNPFSLAEGVANAGTLTIERNTATDNALTVTLSSSDVSELVLPATVTIPAGASTVNVAMATQDDGIVDGNQNVSIQANATDFSPGIISVIVTDNNKPDFQIAEVTLPETVLSALEQFPFRAYITNTGFATAPSGGVLEGYLSEDNILDDNDILVGEYVLQNPIPVGDTLEVWDVALTPYEAGMYYLLFEVNADDNLTEIQYQNNTSPPVLVEIEPDYIGTAIVDDLTYLQGTDITIHGASMKDDGTPFPNAELDVYIIEGPIRREISVTTDENGAYSTVFEPLANEAGHYMVGASFPDEGATTAQDEFDILGVTVNSNQYLLWEVLLNETNTGTISIKNMSDVPLTNVNIQAASLPPGATLTFDNIPVLQGNETLEFNYTLIGTEVSPIGSYQEIELIVSSDENATKELTAYYFCQAQAGYISADISSINRTISQTQSNFLEFKIFNNGEGETGDITVDIPPVDFMSLVSLQTIPSVASGDTSVVIIEFRPTASLPLNTPATGTIVLNATNGNYISIPYTVEKVSDETGGIIVDVVDQYTYFTEEAPHVENAHVKITHYFTGEVFAEGYTDVDGLFMTDNLPEGLLRIVVQADQHEGYDNTINILPGTDITETVFLNYQAISFTWDVVPTEVEDVYEIDLVMEFETNVPLPVVVLEIPDTMPQLFGNETYNFYASLTNHGLITARDVELRFPTNDPEYEFITNYTKMDLLAQQAIQVPVVMQRRDGGQNEGLTSGDMDNIGEISEFIGMEKSGYEGIENMSLSGSCSGVAISVGWYPCGGVEISIQSGDDYEQAGRDCGGGGGGGIGGSWGGGGGFNPCPGCPTGSSSSNNSTPTVSELTDCNDDDDDDDDLPEPDPNTNSDYEGGLDPDLSPGTLITCATNLALTAGTCLGPGALLNLAICGLGITNSSVNPGEDAHESMANVAISALSCLIKSTPLGCATGLFVSIEGCFRGIFINEIISNNPNLKSAMIEETSYDLIQALLAIEARDNFLIEFYGPLVYNENILDLAVIVKENSTEGVVISPAQANTIKMEMQGFDISEEEIDAYILRTNQTIEAWENGISAPNAMYPNIINQDSLSAYRDRIQESQEYAENQGFDSIEEMLESSIELILAEDDDDQGVCASVSINISQELTMTREAFEGTLGVFNGHPTDAIDSLYLNLEILDPQGVLSNDLFQIEVIGLNELSAVDGTGILAAQMEGTATILFIPEPGAAPTVPISYSFGGSISYLDPFSGLMVTVPLIPAVLQVNPSPNLYLHYFMQRDIYGDDPLTEAIEPIIPGELAVMIENNGYGEAMGVVIESAQPEIIDNEKGLAINFNFIGSNLQGEPANMGLNNITFGDIPPLSTRVGQWYFTSSLLGHFINYETNLVHLSSYGNPDLSLISGVELHESIHTIEVYTQEDGIDDFLVNEIQDADETPDAIYLSQGNLIYDVFPADDGFFTGNILAAGNTNTFHITASAFGWNYIKLDDPGNGNFELISVTRDTDGQEIPLKNVWLTHVTLPDSREPNYENKFHFVDDFDGLSEVTYTVVWSPKDPNPPTVVSIEGHPAQVTATQVETLTVTFSEEIIASTFGTEDLTLILQGGSNLIDNSVIITEIDSVTFEVDISSLTVNDGYYIFTAQAAGVEDLTGTSGEVGEQATWTQFLSVPSVLEFTGLPENGLTNQLNTIQILFNMPIDPTTFTADDLAIMLGGAAQAGTLMITPLNAENTLFEVTGITSFIGNDGDYELTVDVTGIASTDGTPGLAMQSANFTMDTQAPQLVNLLRYIGGGLDAQHYTGANMNFDEAIMPFDSTAISLLKDGATQYIAPAEVSVVNPTWYQIEDFGQATYPEGNYILEVDMSMISDLAGNTGTGMEQTIWTVDRTPDLVISGLSIAPDMGHSPSDGITATTDLTVSFGINQDANVVEIYQNDNGTLTLLATLNNVPSGAVDVPLIFDTGGNTAIQIKVTDVDGNTTTDNMSIYIDESALTADWDFSPDQVLTAHPNILTVTVSDQLLDISEVQNALVLFYDNNVLDVSGLSIVATSLTEFELTGLPSVNDAPGVYSVGIDLTLLNKYSSGISGNDISYVSWEIEASDNAMPVADAGQDTLVVGGTYTLDATNSYDPDGDPLAYQWYSPDGIALDDAASATPTFAIPSVNQNMELSFLLSVNDGAEFSTDIVNIQINGRIDFDIKVLLEGAYLDSFGEMTTALNTGRHLLPGQTPASNLAIPTPAGQPYDREPWNYMGTEGENWTDADYSTDVVDWLLVSFRTNIQKNTEIGITAALLLKDGTVQIPDAFSLSTDADSMYIVIEHRNHIGVMTPQAIGIADNALTYDFTLAESYNGNDTGAGQKQLPSGKWAMFAGDADQSDFPSYDIQGLDKIPWEDDNGLFDYYTAPDFDLNGDVNGGDKVFWFDNNGVSSRVPK